ncbi:MAG: type 11 methyltransferase [Microgenomates group bacterium Gr01-1014_7]|nr:MAG: type 11 methyltransferase [Microgenomates group bacterium Gr01-1014_7]
MAKNSRNLPKKQVFCPNCKHKTDIEILDTGQFNLYLCNSCKNGFLYPIPKNLSKYYPKIYWQYPGQLSYIRSTLHNLLQIRRKNWVKKYIKSGKILDVGAGEGVFGKTLGPNFAVTNLESPFAKVANKNVVKADFLKWKTDKKFDGIVFLESLEHVPSPQDYLKKARSLLNKNGYILVECPRFDSWESKLFKDKWLHLDIPRHLAHLTREGLGILASRNNLKVINQSGVLIYEFSPYCFTVSLMRLLKIKPLNLKERSISNLTSMTMALILLPLGVVAETIFHLFDQDPVELSVFQKSIVL